MFHERGMMGYSVVLSSTVLMSALESLRWHFVELTGTVVHNWLLLAYLH